MGKYRWARSQGKAFIPPENLTVESVRDSWHKITDMSGSVQPASVHEQMSLLCNSLTGTTPTIEDTMPRRQNAVDIDEDLCVFRYQVDDVILYALGVGATTADQENLRYLYENSDEFGTLPTFGVIPCMGSLLDAKMINSALEPYKIEFNGAKMLHGEQYLELFQPIPTQGQLTSKARVVDVLDKGSGALVILEADTFDEQNHKVCYNQFALFLVGAGNFGGNKMSSKPEVKAIADAPKRQPDVTVFEQTSPDQVK